MGEAIVMEVDDGVARLTFNRPATRNAIDLAGMQRLGDLLIELASAEAVRCMLVTGAGGSFCSGADLGQGEEEEFGDPRHASLMMHATARVIRALVGSPVAVVAAVPGPAAGVGASIALACDLVVASDDAYFLLPFTGIGLVPDGGATATVAASIGRARALRLALRGERLTAQAAYEAGLVAAVCTADELMVTAEEWATDLANGPRAAIARTKALINDASLAGLGDALDRETAEQIPMLASADFREGVAAFRERRPPVFRGVGKQV